MYKLYNDTEKELFFDNYIPLPNLESLTCTQVIELTENLYNAFDNAFMYGSELLQTALYDDIVKINRKKSFDYLLQVSPGHLASVIHNTKYREIDKAISVSWQYFNACDEQIYFDIGTSIENIENIIKEQYNKALQQDPFRT